MVSAPSGAAEPERPSSGRAAVATDLAAGLVGSLALAAGSWRLLDLPANYLIATTVIYLAMAGAILGLRPADAPGPGIGRANRVTLARACLAVPIAALCLPPVVLGVGAAWWVIVVSTVAMVLDGVDGRVARRTGSQSDFGARFDMELDAALIMALSLLVWASGKVGVWCLAIGLMRYVFVAAGWLWPALQAELPDSLRRKVVCVTQGVVLLIALGPIIPAWAASLVVGVGLLALIYSFAVDSWWALTHATG